MKNNNDHKEKSGSHPTEQQIVDEHFKKYQEVLEKFLRFKGHGDNDIKKILSEHAACPKLEDIKSAQKNAESLLSTMSNSACRVKKALDFEHTIIQFFWNQYREFAIDFVVSSTETNAISKNFFYDLGIMRKLFETIKTPGDIIDNEIISYDHIISNKIHAGFGAIYQYAGRNYNPMGFQDSGARSETVVCQSGRDKDGAHHAWNSIFESLDSYVNNEIRDPNCKHLFEYRLDKTKIISNVDIELSDKQKLLHRLQELQKKENYAVIYAHADDCGGYTVSAITRAKHYYYQKTCEYTPYAIKKFYITDLVSADVKASQDKLLPDALELSASKSQELISLNLGSVEKTAFYQLKTSALQNEEGNQSIPIVLEDESTQIQPGVIYIKFNLEKTGFVFSAFDFKNKKVLLNEPLDTFRGEMPSSLSTEILNEAKLKNEITEALREKNKHICDVDAPFRVEIVCSHYSLAHQDWLPILNAALSKLLAIPKEQDHDAAFLKKLGEFMHLYINIMPYIHGSAAIGEWLMYGLAKFRGINLGPLNSAHLSWDFAAFATLSPEVYGQRFQDFFANPAEFKNQNKAAFFKSAVNNVDGKAQAAQSSNPDKPSHQMK